MKESPILFKAPMVLAILEGRKTQTRRIAPVDFEMYYPDSPAKVIRLLNGKQGWTDCEPSHPFHISQMCPHGKIGDRIWVKETWGYFGGDEYLYQQHAGSVGYRATASALEPVPGGKWRPSIYMPRWASRITLEITGVRCERLNDISEEDAIAEGVQLAHPDTPSTWYRNYAPKCDKEDPYDEICSTAVGSFESLWESINGEGSWGCNPWVWVIEFRKLERRGS